MTMAVTATTATWGRSCSHSALRPRRSSSRTPTTTRMPARAAMGTRATSAPATRHTTSSRSAWSTDAARVREPAWIDTEERTMAPITGMPPKSEDARLAMPWAINS